jgi:hypothetical protein
MQLGKTKRKMPDEAIGIGYLADLILSYMGCLTFFIL